MDKLKAEERQFVEKLRRHFPDSEEVTRLIGLLDQFAPPVEELLWAPGYYDHDLATEALLSLREHDPQSKYRHALEAYVALTAMSSNPYCSMNLDTLARLVHAEFVGLSGGYFVTVKGKQWLAACKEKKRLEEQNDGSVG